jgi:hypothetical protein
MIMIVSHFHIAIGILMLTPMFDVSDHFSAGSALTKQKHAHSMCHMHI